MVYRLLIPSLTFIFLTYPLSVFSAQEPINQTYAWKTLEQSLDLKRTFIDFGQKIDPQEGQGSPTAHLSDMSLKCRQLIYALSKRVPSPEPALSQMIVAACAYSGQPHAIDVMDQVLDPRSGYPVSSWLCAMQYLATQPSQRACDLLIRCMGMPYAEINLASAFFLSQNPYANANPEIVDRILAIQRRFDSAASVWIVELLSRIDQPSAGQAIRQIFNDADQESKAAMLQILAESPLPFDDLVTSAFTSNSPVLLEGALYYSLLHATPSSSWFQSALELTRSPYPRVATLSQILKIKNSQDEMSIQSLVQSIESGDLYTMSGCGLLARLSPGGLDARIKQALIAKLNQVDSRIQINAAMALLEALDPSCLNVMGQLFEDTQGILASSSLGSYSWPTYQLQWLPGSKEAMYQMALAQQFQSRRWILEHVNRLPTSVLIPWYQELVESNEGSCHFLISSTLSQLANPAIVDLLKNWSEAPGKPWLRLGSHLSLWRLNREKESLEKLQAWMSRDNEPMNLFLTSISSSNPMMKGESWIGNFETQVLLQVSQVLCDNADPQSLKSLCTKIASQEHPMDMLPLIAQISRYL